MKRYYRNRFILGAMLSFLILLLLAESGIWLFSYQQMERETNEFLHAMQRSKQEEKTPFAQNAPPPMFGYTPGKRTYPAGFYDILMDADGDILSIQKRGISEDAEVTVQQHLRKAASQKKTGGKIGSYKYSIDYQEDGSARIILLDISIQLQALYHTLRSALIVGAGLMLLLLLILLPVSSRVADAFMRNSEKQKRFITDASHDLKTPVAIIRSNLEVMELLQGKNSWSENIRSQVSRLEHLIGQFVMMARLEETTETAKHEKLDLAEIIREEAEGYRPSLDQKGIRWKQEVPEHLYITGNRQAVAQMLDLMMDNALQYTNEGGEAVLSASAEKKRVHLTLFNTVAQLPEVSPGELTERFTRGNTARTQKTGGAGIGLSAIKRITETHRGKLEVSYRGENGFVVSVQLPAA